MTIYALTKAQIHELRLIRDKDYEYLARGDQADLCGIGMAKPPANAQGYYKLTASGVEARNAAIKRYGLLR